MPIAGLVLTVFFVYRSMVLLLEYCGASFLPILSEVMAAEVFLVAAAVLAAAARMVAGN